MSGCFAELYMDPKALVSETTVSIVGEKSIRNTLASRVTFTVPVLFPTTDVADAEARAANQSQTWQSRQNLSAGMKMNDPRKLSINGGNLNDRRNAI